MSSPRPASTSATVLAATGVGVAIGIVLPPLIRRVVKAIKSSSSSNNNKNDDDDTHAVRSGLSSSASLRIERPKLDAFLSQLMVAAGCSKSNADLVASVLTYADCRGIPSHGCNRADTYINELTAGLVDGSVEPVVSRTSGCCAVVNGRNGLGAVTARLAMLTALKLAKEHGVSIVVCHSSNHYGAAGYWAKMALDEGLVGMSFTNTSPFAVPTGGKTRAVGTNPFCFFAPATNATTGGEEKESFQLDMATTVVPVGKVEVMDRIGKPVPAGWGCDREGKNCTDAAEICKNGGLYPLGGSEETAGYKGYGLGMFVEVLCSVLSGASIGPDVQSWSVSRDGAVNYGHCFVVFDPARFTPGFELRLGKYLDRMRNLPPGNLPGSVMVAGDPEKKFERDAAENGVLLHAPVAATLKALAARFDVNVPVEMESLDVSKSKKSLYA